MNKNTFVFLGFFFEALKPHATSILDTAINLADSAVSASARTDVRAAELDAALSTDTFKSKSSE